MNLKLIGGTLLVTGTCIGAGMLALPVATAQNDLLSSSFLMIACWFVMTVGAFYLLETNLQFASGTNMVTMAKHTLGRAGAILMWLINLLLFYSLLSAYITGGMQITKAFLDHVIGVPVSAKIAAVVFTVVMGAIVLKGIRMVDYSNRGLMTLKGTAMVLLIAAIFPHAQWESIRFGHPAHVLGTATVMLTSFGFASIIPSLRVYFQQEELLLKKVVLIGSLIPLVLYLCWVFAVHAALPSSGPLSLTAMQESGNASTQLAASLVAVTRSHVIHFLAYLFTSICVLTSFLGVGLIVSDFLEDGTKITKKTSKGLCINAGLTFTLPMLIAMFYPKAFMVALSYAGICCVILLALFPMLMAYMMRRKNITIKTYKVGGGNLLLGIAFFVALVALVLSVVFL